MKKIYVLKIMTKIFMILSPSPYLCLFIILFVGMIFVMGMYSLYKNKNIEIDFSKYFTFKTKD